jgi:hypothetical protein
MCWRKRHGNGYGNWITETNFMSCTTCWETPCGCHAPAPACNCPPSPIPPWDRSVQSPLQDILVQNGTLLLDPAVSLLEALAPLGPFAVVLPNGNPRQAYKEIYIPGGSVTGTATWVVSGTFSAGFTQLTFNQLATSAFLRWDGAGWQIVGGNAIPA